MVSEIKRTTLLEAIQNPDCGSCTATPRIVSAVVELPVGMLAGAGATALATDGTRA